MVKKLLKSIYDFFGILKLALLFTNKVKMKSPANHGVFHFCLVGKYPDHDISVVVAFCDFC